MYTDYHWGGITPTFLRDEEKFFQNFNECEETDEYKKYVETVRTNNNLLSELRRDLANIKDNEEYIILTNSKEEYEKVVRELTDKKIDLEIKVDKLKANHPPSKRDKLKVVFEQKSKAEMKARQEHD